MQKTTKIRDNILDEYYQICRTTSNEQLQPLGRKQFFLFADTLRFAESDVCSGIQIVLFGLWQRRIQKLLKHLSSTFLRLLSKVQSQAFNKVLNRPRYKDKGS